MGLLGSTTQLTDSAGNVTDSYTYDAFGAITSHTGTSPQPFTFTGQQQDTNAACGLLYLRARSYDPGLGRFVSQDPLPFLQRYAYAGNDPVNMIDPSGLCWVCDVGTAIGHGAENVGHRVVDNVTDPKSLAGDVQLISGIAVGACVAALVVSGPVSAPVCISAGAVYFAAASAQFALADSTHERAVIVFSAGLGALPLGRAGEVLDDALAPLANPGVVDAPSLPSKEGGMRAGVQ